MEIKQKIEDYSLNAVQDLLKNPVEIQFGSFGVGRATVTWPTSQLKGSLTCDDLETKVSQIYDRTITQLKTEKKLEQEGWQTVSQGKKILEALKELRGRVLVKAMTTSLASTMAQQFFNSNQTKDANGATPIDNFEKRIKEDEKLYPKRRQEQAKPAKDEIDEEDLLREYFARLLEQQFRQRLFNFLKQQNSSSSRTYVFVNGQWTEVNHEGTFEAPRQQDPGFDAYAVLELPRTATQQEVKRKYHQLAVKYHPDRNQGDPEAIQKFQSIQKAYELLKST